MIDLQNLSTLAQEAQKDSPGGWYKDATLARLSGYLSGEDRRFIEAASPDVVLELIASVASGATRIQQLERTIAGLDSVLDEYR